MVNRRKGFTLAELLIVVAIVGILVAVSIPIFTSQLEKSREATDVANMRAAKAAAVAAYYDIEAAGRPTAEGTTIDGLKWNGSFSYEGMYDIATGTFASSNPSNDIKRRSLGKGTANTTNNNYDYYKTGIDYTDKVIYVQILTKTSPWNPDGIGIYIQWREPWTSMNGIHLDYGYEFIPLN